MNDEELRLALAAADPAGPEYDPGLLPRILRETDAQPEGWWRRHWQAPLLAAATVATLALGTAVVAPQLLPVGDGGDVAMESGPAIGGELAPEGIAPGSDTGDRTGAGEPSTVARSASVLVGTDEAQQQRDRFVARIEELGGRVTSESTVTAGAPPVAPQVGMADMWIPYPTGPGIYLTVEVPAERFSEALAAAREAGEVFRSEQTAFDLGSQVVDLQSRIAALEVSVGRLTTLLQQASSVSDVVSVETALAQRQAELEGLRAQQRELTSQTQMSRVSLTLMTPEDARKSLDPQPPRTWWQAFTDGLAELWAWLGKALFIVSPLLLAGAVIWRARRRKQQ